MKRMSILLVLLLAAVAVAPVAAAGTGHIYGVAFLDNDGNGVWGNEPGVSNIPVHFVNGKTHIVLRSAWTDNLKSHLSSGNSDYAPDQYCSHLDENHREVPKGCGGTFGLIPIQTGSWWTVYIEVPAGYVLTSSCGTASNPCYVKALDIAQKWTDGSQWLEFGIGLAPGFGGQMPATTNGQRVYKNVPMPLTGPYVATPMPARSWK